MLTALSTLTILDSSNTYGDVSPERLHEAYVKYATAFLSLCQTDKYSIAIELLDEAINLVPSFLDAYCLREAIWHNHLLKFEETPSQTEERKKYRQSEAWADKRKRVLERDDYRCVRCGHKATEVHHKTYDNIGKELLSDLASVCRKCHEDFPRTFSKSPTSDDVATDVVTEDEWGDVENVFSEPDKDKEVKTPIPKQKAGSDDEDEDWSWE